MTFRAYIAQWTFVGEAIFVDKSIEVMPAGIDAKGLLADVFRLVLSYMNAR